SAGRFLEAKQKEQQINEAMKKAEGGAASNVAAAKGGKAKGGMAKTEMKADNMAKALEESTSTARQYAHLGLGRGPAAPDLVLWEPTLKWTPDGAVVSFGVSPNPTTYRVLFYGSSASGRLGYFQGTLRVR